MLPGYRLGRLLAELATGEKASGLRIERGQAAKEALIEAILTGPLVIGPEGILEKAFGGNALGGARGLGGIGRETITDLPIIIDALDQTAPAILFEVEKPAFVKAC